MNVIKETLSACADRIERNGWCQFEPIGEDGKSMCAVATIDELTRQDPYLYGEVSAALKAHLGVRNLVAWNDRAGRTKDEVVATFRDAADEL